MNSKIFKDKQYHDEADQILDLAKELNKQYWSLSKKMAETSYSTFMCQMEDAQRLGKLAEAIRQLQAVNGTLRHVTCII
ncbi:MAG: hypothetical protein E6Q97_34210 [Desulfurellales bacterium]|nr:MAG: hypothetical protein E6Q97_34210 [Desulfurellales bacterium]